ncbi:MAG: hypothetical protein ABI080_09480 [Candidatus Binatia bacterium]
MAANDRRPRRRPDRLQLVVERRARARIERGEGLVEQQDHRVAGEGACERHALLLAEREVGCARVLVVQRDEIEATARDRRALERGESALSQRDVDILAGVEPGQHAGVAEEQRAIGAGPADTPPAIRPLVGDSSLAIIASKVEVPLPRGPSTATSSPGATSRSTLRIASTAPCVV